MNASTASLPMWRTHRKGILIELLLFSDSLATSIELDPALDGFDLRSGLLDDRVPVATQLMPALQALIMEVRKKPSLDVDALTKQLADAPELPVVVALRDPSLADVRFLMRLGVADVIPLPFSGTELAEVLERLRDDLECRGRSVSSQGRLVSIIKSVGGVGATALLTQIAAKYAAHVQAEGCETCLLDLDIQLGSASLYLGTLPQLGLNDLLEAGSRADGALLRSVTSTHSSGLRFVGAPQEIMPMEAVGPDQIIALLGLAAREFDTVFIDLPTNWTNWSFSALARSDLILLVSELSVASLRQARRQLELIEQQGLSDIPLHIIMNRVEKRLFRSINLGDASRALGREVDFTVANDFETMSAALEQAVMVSQFSKRSRLEKDLGAITDAVSYLTRKVAG